MSKDYRKARSFYAPKKQRLSCILWPTKRFYLVLQFLLQYSSIYNEYQQSHNHNKQALRYNFLIDHDPSHFIIFAFLYTPPKTHVEPLHASTCTNWKEDKASQFSSRNDQQVQCIPTPESHGLYGNSKKHSNMLQEQGHFEGKSRMKATNEYHWLEGDFQKSRRLI